MLIDLTGSAERCIGPMHCNVNTTTSICRLIFKCLTTPTEPANEGHFRMVDVHVPEESIFNAKRPMATKPGFYALHALQDAVKRALADAVPRGVNAEDYGRCCPAHVKSVDGQGKLRILADTEGGGWGAKPFEDGENALLFGDIRVIPVEVIEMRYPVRLRRYALRTDSPGPGKYRGGFGIVKEYECLDDVKLTAGYDRQVCPPQGIAGGEAAQPNQIRISRADGSTIFLPSKQTDYPVKAGETFAFLTAGGGGYGQPVERDLSLIQEDLDEGLFESVEQLERTYQVSITSRPDARRRVDIEASQRLREGGIQRAASGASTCC
jgi:N-methylhydantoinase B